MNDESIHTVLMVGRCWLTPTSNKILSLGNNVINNIVLIYICNVLYVRWFWWKLVEVTLINNNYYYWSACSSSWYKKG